MSIDDLSKEPALSLWAAKDAIFDELHTEEVRHESVINVEIRKYEAFIRTENEFHDRKCSELRGLIAMLDQRLEQEKTS